MQVFVFDLLLQIADGLLQLLDVFIDSEASAHRRRIVVVVFPNLWSLVLGPTHMKKLLEKVCGLFEARTFVLILVLV